MMLDKYRWPFPIKESSNSKGQRNLSNDKFVLAAFFVHFLSNNTIKTRKFNYGVVILKWYHNNLIPVIFYQSTNNGMEIIAYFGNVKSINICTRKMNGKVCATKVRNFEFYVPFKLKTNFQFKLLEAKKLSKSGHNTVGNLNSFNCWLLASEMWATETINA